MKKIGQKEIVQTILNEALKIKRKKELFNEAKKINSELKILNEDKWQGLGYGFKEYDGPSPVLGLSTPSNYEQVDDENCDCKLDQFPKLEKDIEDYEENETELNSVSNSNIEDVLRKENEELKAKLEAIQNAIGNLNEGLEGLWDKAKAGFQGIKTGIKAGMQAGKEAGNMQYKQTKQSQELKNRINSVKAQLNQAKANALQKGEVDFPGIQKILSQIGYKYVGKKSKSLQPLSENETCGTIEEGWGGFLKGAANKIGGDFKGAIQNTADKAKQYVSSVNAAGQQASAEQDQIAADKKSAQATKQYDLSLIAKDYDRIINLVNNL